MFSPVSNIEFASKSLTVKPPSKLIVTVSVALTMVDMLVPPTTFKVSPSPIGCVVPVSAVRSKDAVKPELPVKPVSPLLPVNPVSPCVPRSCASY